MEEFLNKAEILIKAIRADRVKWVVKQIGRGYDIPSHFYDDGQELAARTEGQVYVEMGEKFPGYQVIIGFIHESRASTLQRVLYTNMAHALGLGVGEDR